MILRSEFKNIAEHYKNLVKIANNHYFVGITNEFIVDNYYQVLVQKEKIKPYLHQRGTHKYTNDKSVISQAMQDILRKHNYKIDEDILIKELEVLQSNSGYYFSYEELQSIPIVTSLQLIKKISEISVKESLKLNIQENVDKLIMELKTAILNDNDTSLEDYFCINDYTASFEITYLNEQLKNLDNMSNDMFKQLNDLLSKNNMSLRKIINEVHLENTNASITIDNVFNSVNKLNDIKLEKIFDSLSIVEETFKRDIVFSKMTTESKILYRKQLIKMAKRKRKEPKHYLEELLKQGNNVGEYLLSTNHTKFKTTLYLSIVFVITIFLSYLLSQWLTPYRWVSFLILLIPISEIVIYYLKRIFLYFYKCKPLPKIDFIGGIPEQYKTMVVIPTIIKDAKKVKAVFERLESFYISNKSDNIYFTLLGDCMEYKQEVHENDATVMAVGCRIAEELNKKYGQDRFYFVFRKRKYNEAENSWLGFERKRGALLHFNDLLLGNLSESQKAEYFNIHTFNNFNQKIKYVITLDVDTKLCLNSALELIGTMAHPLNTPVIDEQRNCVTKGYGLMQPKISVDVDSTNKSLFSQIYAGIGGFDPYSDIFSDFYQDVFHEGNFVGKGIYDLEVYQHVLKNRFPNNLILSHDLLEGNYLRCANVLDVELIDEFPSKFLVDANRRSRWARGDFQIIDWITLHVRDTKKDRVKNPLSVLSRWKIFDNVRRGLLDFTLLLIIFLSLFFTTTNPLWWLGLVILVIILPFCSFIKEQFIMQGLNFIPLKYYSILTFGIRSFLLRALSVFSSIPFNAYLYISSFIKASYRMFISKKHLLNWMTAEDAEKIVKTNLPNHIKQFEVNYIIAIMIIIGTLISGNYLIIGILVALVFVQGPICAYFLSKDILLEEGKKCDNDEQYLYDLARRTWRFFADNLNKTNNYLIPDNYQLNRDIKVDSRTSPTNIGLSLVAVISAYELEFITKEKMLNLIKKMFNTINKLAKWNGHLYNWYNTKSLEIIRPNFVSSVDSGNFVASLIVVKEALKDIADKSLINDIESLIDETNFTFLYSNAGLLNGGYNADDGHLVRFNYDRFMSESRIASFVAIAKGDIPSKNWFNLDKTLTVYKKQKGIVSWSGTAFEYFMPLIFMRSYPNTLLDESYYFAYFVQKEFIEQIDSRYPWGVSESAFSELDDAQNYKYKAFGVPYLRYRNESLSRIVISPYSSILAITEFPQEVIENIKKYDQFNMNGDYGFYEAYDITDKTPVFTYFAHHQGMILSSLTNHLKKNVIQNYFSQDKRNNAFNVLTKEKVQVKPSIDFGIIKYRKYAYEKESFDNDVRVFHNISTLPELSVLSNSKYSLLINDRGDSYSKYRNIQLNRYRKITEQDYGLFMYIKDIDSNKVWSNTYAPMNKEPDKYVIVFALDRIKFIRQDNDIITTTEIAVTKSHHAEIRKVSFKNDSNKTKYLELTTYTEPILCENSEDINHPIFNKLFIDSEYDSGTNSIIMYRKLRDSNLYYYMINRLLVEGEHDDYEYETNRINFIGRNHNLNNPVALNKKLTNHIGISLDPIISLRTRIEIPKNEERSVYLVSGFGKSKEQVLNIVRTYSNEEVITEQGFEVATFMSNVTNKMVNITGDDMRLYNIMLNYLLQTSHISINAERSHILANNVLNQANLWRFGISGDHPIFLLEVKDIDDLSLIKEILHAFEYYKSKSIFIDLVIINSENKQYAGVISKEIENEKYHMYALNSFDRTPGNIFVLEYENISEQEMNLFKMAARLKIDSAKYHSLQEYINKLQKLNTVSRREKNNVINSLPIPYNEKELSFYNNFGGFINNGKEYVITNNNTPLAWCNILANKKFGTVVANNNCGFTYALNSREFKLTSWTNDVLLNDCSEGIRINDMNINFALTKFGFGYSEFQSRIKKLDITLTEFVAHEDSCKFYKLRIRNNASRKQRIVLKYWINPCLGVTEEKTSRYLLCDFDMDNNAVLIRNTYSQYFNDILTYMASTENISTVNINRVLFKEIEVEFYLNTGEEKELAFMLGCTNKSSVKDDINKYMNIESINKELEQVKSLWQEKLEVVQVKTPDDSFNYMVNGWLLYQTLSSRLYAKTGFYQVGGAYGFRDQLQDAMNICTVNPEMTKEQILINAKHQFVEGDVLHWWHEQTSAGLRSSFKDDYLWLIYAVSEYLNVTDDYQMLDEQIEFVEGPILENKEKEKYGVFHYSNTKSALYNHCQLAINRAMHEMGSNGLPLMGGGDWNDGMNKIGINGSGTSVWLGFFLYQMIDKFVGFTKKYKPEIDINGYTKFNENLKKALREVAWDGEYYLRAIFDNGHKLGSHLNNECSIDLLSQSFAILTDIADKKQEKSIINKVEEKLVDKNSKLIKLLDPAFKNSEDDPGYIMNYPPGIRENGGQYTHSVAWYLMALLKSGYRDQAFNYYQMINPINRNLTKDDAMKYKIEPYVLAADIYSNKEFPGRGGWTWYTGSSGWFYRVALVDILGFQLNGQTLYIEPKAPTSWSSFEITYHYQDTIYEIKVILNAEENKIEVDNKIIDNNGIILKNDKLKHIVTVKRRNLQ